jgi:hypothetical protein
VADYEERKLSFQEFFGAPRAERVASYEGFSEYNDESGPESLIVALKAAAKKAADDPNRGSDLPAWFEVTRLRILVGNPNVKVLGATITNSAAPSSDPE